MADKMPKPGMTPADTRTWTFESKFTSRLCDAIGTERAGLVKDLLEKEDFRQLLDLTIDPNVYTDPRQFAEDYLVTKVLSKSYSMPLDCDREAAARAEFFRAEVHNRSTNDRLLQGQHPDWVYDVSGELLTILGPLGTSQLNRLPTLGTFGSGACIGVRTDGLTRSKKYDALPVMTERLLPVWEGLAGPYVVDYWSQQASFMGLSGGWKALANMTSGNHHFTVPKNAERDRNAAKESPWNMKIQLGTGRLIEERLRMFGVDLHDQRKNQLLASLAWERGLATLDLRSASDMEALQTVILLLTANGCPQGFRWLHLLMLGRSDRMFVLDEVGKKKVWHTLEMFSSMGNGFTFPLESAVFLAVVRSVVPKDRRMDTAVYGDDIIVPQEHVQTVIDRLEYLGFQVNTQKSCLAGSFYESCGTDWFKGHQVRPFYLRREDAHDVIPYPLQVANALRLWLTRVYGFCPERFLPLWKWCRGQVPNVWNHPVSTELGDSGVCVSFEEWRAENPSANPDAFGRWEVEHVLCPSVDVDRRSWGVLTDALATNEDLADLEPDGYRPTRWSFEPSRNRRDLGDLARHWALRDLPIKGTGGREALRNQFGTPRLAKTTTDWNLSRVSNWD